MQHIVQWLSNWFFHYTDAMSRLPITQKSTAKYDERDVIPKVLARETTKDNPLQLLVEVLKIGKQINKQDRFGIDQTGHGTVIPKLLQKIML